MTADRLAQALSALLNDTQHAEHNCDDDQCPVREAREALAAHRAQAPAEAHEDERTAFGAYWTSVIADRSQYMGTTTADLAWNSWQARAARPNVQPKGTAIFDLTEARGIVIDAIRRMRAGHVACSDLEHSAEEFLQATHAAAKPDELWTRTLEERDRYHEVADSLAQGIADYLGVDIGEHSSANCPWTRALDELDAAKGGPLLPIYVTEINRLRNVIQAACTGGLGHMIERWKQLFPDAPVPTVHATQAPAPAPAPAAPRPFDAVKSFADSVLSMLDERIKAAERNSHPFMDKFGDHPETIVAAKAQASELREVRTQVRILGDRALVDLMKFRPATSAPAVKAESDDASFEVWEGDELFAGTSGPRAQAWAELLRYAAQCEGVVRVFEVIRVERTLSYVPVQGTGGANG